LLIIQNTDTRQISMLAIEANLFFTQTIPLTVVTSEQISKRMMVARQVFRH
jgi:hypothetical protein